MRVIKLKMRPGCCSSNNLLEIDELFLVHENGNFFMKKETMHDYLLKNPGSIKVNISPYPNVIPTTSVRGEKYVKSSPNSIGRDNLLELPRE